MRFVGSTLGFKLLQCMLSACILGDCFQQYLEQAKTEHPTKTLVVLQSLEHPTNAKHSASAPLRKGWKDKFTQSEDGTYRVGDRQVVAQDQIFDIINDSLDHEVSVSGSWKRLQDQYFGIKRRDVETLQTLRYQFREVMTIDKYTKHLDRFSQHLPSRLPQSAYTEVLPTVVQLLRGLSRENLFNVKRVTSGKPAERLMNEGDRPALFIIDERNLLQRLKPPSSAIPNFLKELDGTLTTTVTDMARTDTSGFSGHPTTTPAAIARFEQRTTAQSAAHCSVNNALGDFRPPLNLLDLAVPIDSQLPHHTPSCLATDRFRIMQKLGKMASQSHSGKTGQVAPMDLLGCVNFVLVAHADAVSLTHHDRHAVMTWLRVLQGLKLWILWPDMSPAEWAEFEDEDHQMWWTGGRPQWVLIRPGETLVMAKCVPHAVITLEDSLCVGGSFWDSQDMPDIIAEIHKEMLVPGRGTTNEDIAEQLLPILKILQQETASPTHKAEKQSLPGTGSENFSKLLKATISTVTLQQQPKQKPKRKRRQKG